MTSSAVEIRGQKDGLWIYFDDQAGIGAVLSGLEEKLASSNNFFSGADVRIDTGTRLLSPDEKKRVHWLVEQRYGLRIRHLTCSTKPETPPHLPIYAIPQPPAAAPMPAPEPIQIHAPEPLRSEPIPHIEAPQNEPEEPDATYEGEDADFMKQLDETFYGPATRTREAAPEFSNDHLYEREETAFYFRGTVRSGQTLEFQGNIVILGDVNAGAYVVASGDIIVMGRLYGVVHAGAEGEARATIIGAHFQPSQLRIAQYIGRPPDEQPRSRPKQPQTEKAYIKDGMIVIEPIL